MDRKQRLYVWIAGVFVSALIAGDLIGGKFFRVAGLDLSVGMIPFPLTFVLTDIVNEFYGTEGARRITFVGLGMAIFVFSVINLALALPVSPESPMSQELFARAFGWSSRLYVASLVAYVIGQLLDIWIFQLFLRMTGHRFLWLRATGSTVFSQAIDTLVVNFVLLSGKRSLEFILTVARNGYIVKLLIAICMTPLIYLGRGLFLRYLEPAGSEVVGASIVGASASDG
jgi:queuosine precursor transporter